MTSAQDLRALKVFVRSPVTQDMIHKLVVTTLQVIPCQDDKAKSGRRSMPSLMTFINRLVKHTNVYTGTLMATLVLLNRLKVKLPHNAQGLACTRHRIFLSCLILASKFHNDSSPKNVHWAAYTDGLFSLKDINLMERQLLQLLNWKVQVSNDDMVAHCARFLNPIREDMAKAAKLQHFLHTQHADHAWTGPGSMSRSSLVASALSLSLMSSHSRGSSVSSHSDRPSLCSSVGSGSPASPAVPAPTAHKPQPHYPVPQHLPQMLPLLAPPLLHGCWAADVVDPAIERTARAEEMELSRMLQDLYARRPVH